MGNSEAGWKAGGGLCTLVAVRGCGLGCGC